MGKSAAEGRVLLEARHVSARDDRGVKTLDDVSLALRAGEVVGIAGVEGNGQIELAEVLAGVRRASGGTVLVEGTELSTRSAKAFIRKKIAYVPADRNHVGSVPDFPLYENWILRDAQPPKRGPFLDYAAIRRETAKAMEQFDDAG